MTDAAALAEQIRAAASLVRKLKRAASLVAGTRARQAEGQLDAAAVVIDQARSFLLAAGSGVMPGTRADPRKDP